jgi:hypothetical protein
MAIPFDEVIASLPIEEQAAIEKRTQELIAEYMALQDLRKARHLTQEKIT